jgi:hypothetical protein
VPGGNGGSGVAAAGGCSAAPLRGWAGAVVARTASANATAGTATQRREIVRYGFAVAISREFSTEIGAFSSRRPRFVTHRGVC